MTDEQRPLEIESAEDEGLLGLVTRAEHAVLDSTTDPVGVLRIELVTPDEEPSPEHPLVAVEAAFVERAGSGVVERLDVHLGMRLPKAPEREQLRALLAACGGTAYTSVCLSSDGRELLDLTLHFGSVIKLFGRCTALPGDQLRGEQVGTCQHVLGALGVKSSTRGEELQVAARRLGGPPSSSDQVDALLRARDRGIDVELYASTLPVTRSVRIALTGPADSTDFTCSVSRQIPKDATSIARDAVALRDIVKRELGFDFGGRRWRIDNAHGERAEHRPHGPMGGGARVQWSLNWGAKRR